MIDVIELKGIHNFKLVQQGVTIKARDCEGTGDIYQCTDCGIDARRVGHKEHVHIIGTEKQIERCIWNSKKIPKFVESLIEDKEKGIVKGVIYKVLPFHDEHNKSGSLAVWITTYKGQQFLWRRDFSKRIAARYNVANNVKLTQEAKAAWDAIDHVEARAKARARALSRTQMRRA